jgi:ankyrin repeat protein
MARDNAIVGEFIDAVGQDATRAEGILSANPWLRDARWLHEETILHFLAIEGTAEQVELLGQWDFDPNAVNKFGDSPLIDVATLGREDVAGVLLQVGANPNARSATMGCVLHCAVRSGNPRLVELLLARGADPNCVTELGETVLDALSDDGEQRAAIEQVLARYGLRKSDQ